MAILSHSLTRLGPETPSIIALGRGSGGRNIAVFDDSLETTAVCFAVSEEPPVQLHLTYLWHAQCKLSCTSSCSSCHALLGITHRGMGKDIRKC